MSATNRGYERHKDDYYKTPYYIAREFLKAFLDNEGITNADVLKWADPSCGGDEDSEAVYPYILKQIVNPAVLSTFDIRDDSKANYICNYLETDIKKHDIIITNPPFDLALDFIDKALSDVNAGGYVIMLLRINFYGSAKRVPYFRNNMPYATYFHANRPSFTMKGTDATEYAHFVWRKGENPEYSKLYHLGEETPAHRARMKAEAKEKKN